MQKTRVSAEYAVGFLALVAFVTAVWGWEHMTEEQRKRIFSGG